MQQRIPQHGSVASAEHKPVPALPLRILWVMLHLLPQCVRHGRSVDGKAGVAALCLFNGLRRQKTDGFY